MEPITAERCRQLLTETRVGHLGVVDDDGVYVTPVSYVLLGDSVYLRTAPGRRLQAIRSSPRVCFETCHVDKETGAWESVIVWGAAREVETETIIQQVVDELLAKYRDSIGELLSPSRDTALPLDSYAVIEIPIEAMTGRRSGGPFQIHTRPGRL